MSVLGVYNIKGGVGKTAAAVNLAYLAASERRRTLVWDLDPQAAATYYFRVKPKVKGGSKALVYRKRELTEQIKGTDFDYLDLLPSDFSYRYMDLLLADTKKPTKRLMSLMRRPSLEYDYIFLDCPPSISLVSENIFRAVETLLVPMIPTTLSVRTLHQLNDFLEGNRQIGKLRVLPFFSMVDRRKRLHTDLMERLSERYPDTLTAVIPYASEVERMGIYRMPLVAYSPNSEVTGAYQRLWDELKSRL